MTSALGYTKVARVARKDHRCYDCGRLIRRGSTYNDTTALPWYDFNPRPGHYTRGRFCGMCSPVDSDAVERLAEGLG